MNWYDYLLIGELMLILFWMSVKSWQFLFELFMSKVMKRDFEQEAIDRVFTHRKLKAGQSLIVKYNDGTVVTMTRGDK